MFTKEDDSPELIMNSTTELLYGESNEPFHYNGPTIKDNISDIIINEEMIKDLLNDTDPNKSTTHDCIHPRILKECSSSLAPALLHIYKKSLATGTLPSHWKKGTVTPLHKSGSRHTANNYRPITITSQLCRILEKIIKAQLVDHLEDNSFLSEDQHGFRRKRSCLSNLLMEPFQR